MVGSAMVGGAMVSGAVVGGAAGHGATGASHDKVPSGWTEERRVGKARAYKIFYGPHGERAQSLLQAWRLHEGWNMAGAPGARRAQAGKSRSRTEGVVCREMRNFDESGSKAKVAARLQDRKASALRNRTLANGGVANSGIASSGIAKRGIARRGGGAVLARAPKAAEVGAKIAECAGIVAKVASKEAAATFVRHPPQHASMLANPVTDDTLRATLGPALTCGTLPTPQYARALAMLTLEAMRKPLPGPRPPVALTASAAMACDAMGQSPAAANMVDDAVDSTAVPDVLSASAVAALPGRLFVLLAVEMEALGNCDDLEPWRSTCWRAHSLKARGDACFARGEWLHSADCYSAALHIVSHRDEPALLHSRHVTCTAKRASGEGREADLCDRGSEGSNGERRLRVVLLSSRAETRLQGGQWDAALADCESALALDSTHMRSIARRERARRGGALADRVGVCSVIAGSSGEAPSVAKVDCSDLAMRVLRGSKVFCEALAEASGPPPPTARASPAHLSWPPFSEVCVYWLPVSHHHSNVPYAHPPS